MRIDNTTVGDITLNYRTGRAVVVPAGKYVIRDASELDYLDDTAVTLALFASGALVLKNDDGSAWTGAALPSAPKVPVAPQPLMVSTSSDGGIAPKITIGSQRLVSLGLRTNPLRVATFGDSTANVGLGNTDNAIFDAPFPASGPTIVSYELSKWSVYQKYPQAKMVANGGISGETTTQMLARDNAAYSPTRKSISDVLACAPDVVFLRCGSINNLTPITPATYDSIIATAYSEHCRIVQRFLSAGVAVVDEGLFGYSGAVATYPDLVRSALITLRGMYRDYIASLDRPNAVYIDSSLSDSTGNFIAGSNDGIHLNMYGSQMLGSIEAIALTLMFGASSGPRFPGANLISNALFANTGSVAYGTAPTGYSATGSNATLANAKLEIIDGKVYWTVEVTPTTASNGVTLNTPFDVTAMGIAANDVLGFEMDVFAAGLDGVSAPPAVTGYYVRNDIYKSGAGRFVPCETVTAMGGFPGPYKAHVSFAYRCQEASAALTASSNCPFLFNTGSLTPFKVGIAHPRLVKLGVAAVSN